MNIFYIVSIIINAIVCCYLWERSVKQEIKIERLEQQLKENDITLCHIAKILKGQ